MKTILTITTFAIAVMVFAFNANPVMAKGEGCPEGQVSTYGGGCTKKRVPGERRPNPDERAREDNERWMKCLAGVRLGQEREEDCNRIFSQIDEVRDPDQAGERDVADSGNDGPSSAAQESDQ
ncbi:MAG: hypothetical protein OXF24_04885 [Hyphomicrobiales bacterium]|nr:hypothetical protein [Hyphomicrobiales bacterium]